MRYGLALEQVESGLWMAWMLDLPGCTSIGRTQDEAVKVAEPRISQHLDWLDAHGEAGFGPLFTRAAIDIQVEEVFHSSNGDGRGTSVAFFEADAMPLKGDEIDEGLKVLTFTRKDLMALVRHLPSETLEQPIEGDMLGSLSTILEHMAWAEWWYCDRLGITLERDQIPANPVAKLDVIRGWLRARLRELAGYRMVVEQMGEVWSPRKLLRRAIWHELEHTGHIARILAGDPGAPPPPVEL